MNVDAPAVTPASPTAGAPRLKSRHLLGIAGLEAAEIALILDTAEAMKEIGTRPIKKVPALRGRTVVNLFFEPSTRTRTSFEIAEKRLSADTLSIATATSSVTKGETLIDFGRPRAIQLIVMVDRGHRELPIKADYVGKNLPTSARQSVQVRLQEIDGADEVVIEGEP